MQRRGAKDPDCPSKTEKRNRPVSLQNRSRDNKNQQPQIHEENSGIPEKPKPSSDLIRAEHPTKHLMSEAQKQLSLEKLTADQAKEACREDPLSHPIETLQHRNTRAR
ncbi:predicted protein [Arabidopsis lyrata subsp. lyrata]|uniref:Predicted protein n=1 Tax=Arabidopsis lyrata subsp. lyrata TaxID=81972 RepID=D7LE92_ARALL|nr:predicted protein [Arabidopsis lyrata subsp. lyrata]